MTVETTEGLSISRTSSSGKKIRDRKCPLPQFTARRRKEVLQQLQPKHRASARWRELLHRALGAGGQRNEECRPAGELKGAIKEDGIRDGPKQVTAGRRAQERSFGGNHSHEDHSLPGKNAAIRRAWEGRHTRAPGRPSCQNAQKASLLYAPWLHLWASVQTQLSTQAGSLKEETGPWGSHT